MRVFLELEDGKIVEIFNYKPITVSGVFGTKGNHIPCAEKIKEIIITLLKIKPRAQRDYAYYAFIYNAGYAEIRYYSNTSSIKDASKGILVSAFENKIELNKIRDLIKFQITRAWHDLAELAEKELNHWIK